MLRTVTFALATSALVAAAATYGAPATTLIAAAQTTAPGRAQYGTFGFDSAGMDRSVQPGDDFFEYANGTWIKNNQIPADKSRYGMFNVLDDLSRERTRKIINEQSKDPNSKIGNAYASFMDEQAIEAKGLTPLNPWLNRIKAIRGKAGLPALYAEADRIGVNIPVRMFVGQDRKASDRYAINMSQSGLGMPDRDYYLSSDPKLVETRNKYLQHLTNVLTLAGEQNAAARAQAILDLETKIAQAHWTRAESRDANKTYNKRTLAQLAKEAPGLDFGSLAKDLGANVGYVVVSQPSAIRGIAAALSSTPLPVLKDQLLVRSIESYSSFLPKRFDQENFAFYGTT